MPNSVEVRGEYSKQIDTAHHAEKKWHLPWRSTRRLIVAVHESIWEAVLQDLLLHG